MSPQRNRTYKKGLNGNNGRWWAYKVFILLDGSLCRLWYIFKIQTFLKSVSAFTLDLSFLCLLLLTMVQVGLLPPPWGGNEETRVCCILLQFRVKYITVISEIKIIGEISRIFTRIIGKDTSFSAGFAQLLECKHRFLAVILATSWWEPAWGELRDSKEDMMKVRVLETWSDHLDLPGLCWVRFWIRLLAL